MSEGSTEPFADVEPESLAPADVDADELRAALTAETAVVRTRGARVAVAVAAQDVEAALPFVDDIAARLDDDSLAVARHAGNAAVMITESHPEALADHLDHVVTLTESDLGGIRGLGATVLSNVVLQAPETVAPHVGRLVGILADAEGTYDQSDLQLENVQELDRQTQEALSQQNQEEAEKRIAAVQIVANVVVAVAEADHEYVLDDLDAVADVVADGDPLVVGPMLDVFCEVAAADPAAVADYEGTVADRLDDPEPSRRARAIQFVGLTGATEYAPKLRDIAAETDDEDMQELAADTADFLDSLDE